MYYLNVVLQLVRISKSLIALGTGELRGAMIPTVPREFSLVVEHHGTLGTLQRWILVHYGNVPFYVAYLRELLATMRTWELFHFHLNIVIRQLEVC